MKKMAKKNFGPFLSRSRGQAVSISRRPPPSVTTWWKSRRYAHRKNLCDGPWSSIIVYVIFYNSGNDTLPVPSVWPEKSHHFSWVLFLVMDQALIFLCAFMLAGNLVWHKHWEAAPDIFFEPFTHLRSCAFFFFLHFPIFP